MSTTESEAQASSSQSITVADNSRRWTETYQEKVIRKVTENPWVPAGAALTTYALVMASVRLRQGNSKKFQYWLRYRVGLQTLTIFAVLGGLYKYGQANLEENQRVMDKKREKEMEKKALLEKEEFEERIRQAGQVQREEEAIRATRKGKTMSADTNSGVVAQTSSSWTSWLGGSWFGGSKSTATPEPSKVIPPSPSPPTPTNAQKPSDSSWWRYFGWSKSSSEDSSSSTDKDTPK